MNDYPVSFYPRLGCSSFSAGLVTRKIFKPPLRGFTNTRIVSVSGTGTESVSRNAVVPGRVMHVASISNSVKYERYVGCLALERLLSKIWKIVIEISRD